MKRYIHSATNNKKYQCYYYTTVFTETPDGRSRGHQGKKVLTEVFDNEADAEKYCRTHVGSQKVGDEWIENEMEYDEIDASTEGYASELNFTQKEGLGLNDPVLKLSNGDEVSVHISYADRGTNRIDSELGSGEVEHFTDQFIEKGVGGRKYRLTREVAILDPEYAKSVKKPRFRSKIVKVSEER